MNILPLLQKKLQKEHKIENYNRSIAYRGVKYNLSSEINESHGTFCYRGRIYRK